MTTEISPNVLESAQRLLRLDEEREKSLMAKFFMRLNESYSQIFESVHHYRLHQMKK